MDADLNQLEDKQLSGVRDLSDAPFQGTRSRLRIQVRPLRHRYYGKVFNDLHSETIGYHLVPHQPYHSYVESDGFRLETDHLGYPVYVSLARWQNAAERGPLTIPTNFELAELRFLDLRIHFGTPSVYHDPDNALIRIAFRECAKCYHLALEPHAIWSIDTDGNLASLWLRQITLDPTGKRFLKWRRRAWSRVRRDFKAGRLTFPQLPTPLSAPEKTHGH